MDVLLFEPGKYPRSVSVDTLEEMQQLVGGWITATYPFNDPVALVANDEGLLLKLPFNRMVDPYHPSVGNFFLAGIGTEKLCMILRFWCVTPGNRYNLPESLLPRSSINGSPIMGWNKHPHRNRYDRWSYLFLYYQTDKRKAGNQNENRIYCKSKRWSWQKHYRHQHGRSSGQTRQIGSVHRL